MTASSDRSGPIGGALSLAGLLALFVTAIDWISAIWPFDPGEIRWRYIAIGSTAGFTVTATIGLVLLAFGQTMGGREARVRVLGYFAAALAALLGVALGVFLLDGVQMAGMAEPGARSAKLVGVTIAALKLAGATAVFASIALGLLRSAAPPAAPRTRPGPIVGSPPHKG